MTAEIISFQEEVDRRYSEGKVSMDFMIRVDMLFNGYDPRNEDDIEEYWNDLMDKHRNGDNSNDNV